MDYQISRRQMLKGGSLIAVGLVAPRWLSSIAEADMVRARRGEKPLGDTILVVCQFSGGNDGLNCVIPYADAKYRSLRPTIGISEDKVLKLNEHMGLHPNLAPIQTLYKEGKVAIIQGVGYPHPNRSHFESMKIWQSASPELKFTDGWIGRHLDQELKLGPLNPVVAVGLTNEQPLALRGENVSVPCFASLQDVNALVGNAETQELLRKVQGNANHLTTEEQVVRNATDSALNAMDILSKQIGGYTPKQTYGTDQFGQGFKQIGQLIATSPATRVVYFSSGGFDTHANQVATHEKLYSQFSAAVLAFQRELESLGKADKVLLLTFSEFGRRAYENGSGTDHGKAAPMFLIGSKVKGGFYGPNPDLSNLDQGDVPFSIDFRQMYATALDSWVGGDSETVLGQKFEAMPVFN